MIRVFIKKIVASVILKAVGFELENFEELIAKKHKKYVTVLINHTSNWDGFLSFLTCWIVDARFKILLKNSAFRKKWVSLIFRILGFIPVDRSKKTGLVEILVEEYNKRDEMTFLLAPEGTRRKVETLKTGFYNIATAANIPLLLAGYDYPRKKVICGGFFFPSGDYDSDLKKILEFYETKTIAKFPKNAFIQNLNSK